jgi:hypothetical protein
VLELYAEPYDPDRPSSRVRRGAAASGGRYSDPDTRPARSVAANRLLVPPQRDPCNLFTTIEPLARLAPHRSDRPPHGRGLRSPDEVNCRRAVSRRHPRSRRARQPQRARQSPLCVAFASAEARRIARKLEFHFTPKHRSWLNVAATSSRCSPASAWRGDSATSTPHVGEIAAWERQRNLDRPTIRWHFTVDQACRKLKRLYPDPA